MSKWLKHTVTEGECLIWTRCLNSDGYPRAGNASTSNLKVHREVFFDVNGYYPDVVRHKCDEPRCINPHHLLPGTPTDNMKDRRDRGRTHNHVPYEEYERCRYLRDRGHTYREIAETLNVTYKRVEYILTRFGKES